jgi:hypothetical protein
MLKVHEFVWGISWILSLCQKKFNELALVIKACILSLWSFEMCMGPNHKEVVKK